jgi:hypothetical protein
MARNPQPRWRVHRRGNLKKSIALGMILRQWRLVARLREPRSKFRKLADKLGSDP